MRNLKKKFQQLFNEADEDKLSGTLFNLLITALFFAVVVLIIDVVLHLFEYTNIGVFGDFFGGVLNPILTFLTFIGLIFTIVIQRKELGQATREYRKTADALTTQALENTFFNILDLHHKIVENLSIIPTSIKISRQKDLPELFVYKKVAKHRSVGREAFSTVIDFITNQNYFTATNTLIPTHIIDRYRIIQKHNNHILGHYFRNLYQALKLVDAQSYISFEKKKQYTGIIRAQLSSEELSLLFINCLEGVCDDGQFKDLLVRYAMLEHLPFTTPQIDSRGYHQIDGTEIYFTDESLMYYRKERYKLPPDSGWGAFGSNPNIPSHLR